MNVQGRIQRRNDLQAQADNVYLPLEERVRALTELFFHFGQDRYNAARAVRQIEDLVTPKVYVDPEPQVTYAHQADPQGARYKQYAKDPIPAWAVDVQPLKA
jgi:hypothetical protein